MGVAAGDWMVIYGGVAVNFGPISWSGCISSRNIWLIMIFLLSKSQLIFSFTASAKEVEKSSKTPWNIGLIAGEQRARPLGQELSHRSVRNEERRQNGLLSIGQKSVAQEENHPWWCLHFIPALASQATTEFAGSCEILSPSCVLTLRGLCIPRMGTRIRDPRAAPQSCWGTSLHPGSNKTNDPWASLPVSDPCKWLSWASTNPTDV